MWKCRHIHMQLNLTLRPPYIKTTCFSRPYNCAGSKFYTSNMIELVYNLYKGTILCWSLGWSSWEHARPPKEPTKYGPYRHKWSLSACFTLPGTVQFPAWPQDGQEYGEHWRPTLRLGQTWHKKSQGAPGITSTLNCYHGLRNFTQRWLKLVAGMQLGLSEYHTQKKKHFGSTSTTILGQKF